MPLGKLDTRINEQPGLQGKVPGMAFAWCAVRLVLSVNLNLPYYLPIRLHMIIHRGKLDGQGMKVLPFLTNINREQDTRN